MGHGWRIGSVRGFCFICSIQQWLSDKWRMSCPGGSEATLRSLVKPSIGPRINGYNANSHIPIGEENCPQKWGPPSTKSHTKLTLIGMVVAEQAPGLPVVSTHFL